jgi:basic amino acid/polyamine antiporter, APA family
MACLTVASSLFIKMKKPESFTSPFKPLFQIIFLVFNVGVLFYTLYSRPIESCIGLGIVFLGFVIYKFDKPDFSRGTISPE